MKLREHRKNINLALQGGGSHGAFTAGVLHHLGELEELKVATIAGSSSGAVNAVLFASGYLQRGTAGAQSALNRFWGDLPERVPEFLQLGSAGAGGPRGLNPYASLAGILGPYTTNPLDFNPMRELLEELVDFELLRAQRNIELRIGATHVRTGRLRVFETGEVDVNVVLASACLPTLHHTVTVDGEAYWDGGFSGNPPLFPLIFDSDVSDLLVVLLQPLLREDVPTTPSAIQQRAAELSFTTAFLREMRAIAYYKQRIDKEWFSIGPLERELHRLRLHLISDEGYFQRLDNGSRYVTKRDFLNELFSAGRAAAEVWAEERLREVGKHSTIELEEFL